MDDQLLDADAILTSVLAKPQLEKYTTVKRMMEDIQDAAHPDANISIEVGTRQDNCGVLSSQFQS